jgi:hypothetical protein
MRRAQPRIVSSNLAIGSNSSYALSPVIRVKVTSLISARSTVALEKAVYRHDRRKISKDFLTRRSKPVTSHRQAWRLLELQD